MCTQLGNMCTQLGNIRTQVGNKTFLTNYFLFAVIHYTATVGEGDETRATLNGDKKYEFQTGDVLRISGENIRPDADYGCGYCQCHLLGRPDLQWQWYSCRRPSRWHVAIRRWLARLLLVVDVRHGILQSTPRLQFEQCWHLLWPIRLRPTLPWLLCSPSAVESHGTNLKSILSKFRTHLSFIRKQKSEQNYQILLAFCSVFAAFLLFFRCFSAVFWPILSFCHANVTRNALTIRECCKMTLKSPI